MGSIESGPPSTVLTTFVSMGRDRSSPEGVYIYMKNKTLNLVFPLYSPRDEGRGKLAPLNGASFSCVIIRMQQ